MCMCVSVNTQFPLSILYMQMLAILSSFALLLYLNEADVLVVVPVVLIAPENADRHDDGGHSGPYRVVEAHVVAVVVLVELVAEEDGVAKEPRAAGETRVVQPHGDRVTNSLHVYNDIN